MAAKIITNPMALERDQVKAPTMDTLHQVCLAINELAGDIARHLRDDTTLNDTPSFRRFMAACLEGMARKILAVKRLGPGYIVEAGAILRVHTEIAVDFFWLVAHYCHRRPDAEQLAEQFFAIRGRQFLKQAEPAREALRQDTFLKDFFDDSAWDRDVEAARADVKGTRIRNDNWRIVKDITKPSDAKWDARCKRAAKQAERIANLKHAPFLRNVEVLNSYSHWDPAHIQHHSPEFEDALFRRHLNNAIGFLLDVMIGVCSISRLELPERAKALTLEIVYMST